MSLPSLRDLATATPAAGGLRLLPAPDCDPPYDDERPDGKPLPLRPVGFALRLLPPAIAEEEEERRTPGADLPAARPFARALVQRLLEVFAGVRPISQLQRDTTWELYDELAALLARRPLPTGSRPTPRCIRSVHVQVRPEGVAEGCATVLRSGRAGALAFRLEGIGGAWRCTELVGV